MHLFLNQIHIQMKKLLLCAFFLGLLTTTAFSQTDRYWVANNASTSRIATNKAVARKSFPTTFKLFNLNFERFQK